MRTPDPVAEAVLDARADYAIASVPTRYPANADPYPRGETATRENAPMAWDLVRFWIWTAPESAEPVEEIARIAMEYTGE